ncbi:MAG: deoxyribodipyrimidine photo-lyase [Bacteroidia bacterium]|nr:deoxyribodipyrimidine photo-lyase [Bacteroidia bacterium]
MSKRLHNIFWFRRDFRLKDNHGLYESLKAGNVIPIFIFDKNILDRLESKSDRRVHFIYNQIIKLKRQIVKHGSDLKIFYGSPADVFKELLDSFKVEGVFANRDYEPYAKERDTEVENILKSQDVKFHTFKDHVIFEKKEVVKDDGDPYVVYTPYSKVWKEKLKETGISDFNSESELDAFAEIKSEDPLSLREIGFEESDGNWPDSEVEDELFRKYGDRRNFPAKEGTSRLGVHLRFGTISIRSLFKRVQKLSETYVNELIWREFYQMILWNFPKVVDHEFRDKYAGIPWRNNEAEFDAWCKGETGYPIVDAGMRELNETGYMHNRVRMIVASFLTKHLLIDWRWGETYFAQKLLDYELASNNGGWQWAAGCGTDAAPYFRVFNPELQKEKFDKQEEYIKMWVPEYESKDYPEPIVDHKKARVRALDTYKKALEAAGR